MIKRLPLYFILLLGFNISTILAQGHLISGTVVDANGVPLPGVTVLEKDTSNGVVSGLDGNYILTTSSVSYTHLTLPTTPYV